MTCKHFTHDHHTELDGFGQCSKIIEFQAKGASPAMVAKVIRENLNGGQIWGENNYIFERACCTIERGCEKFEESDN